MCFHLSNIRIKTYLKIGHSESRPMSDPDTNLIKWFQGKGDPVVAEWLESQLFSLMPSVSFKNIETESCAVSRSSTGKQFIDRIDESGIHVLLAGNGYSAKSSDELGRIAAHKIIFVRCQKSILTLILESNIKGYKP